MTTFTFTDIGDVDSDDIKCYKNVRRSDVMSPFGGEFDKVSAGSDEVKLYLKDGTSQTTRDLSGIMQLDVSQIQEC